MISGCRTMRTVTTADMSATIDAVRRFGRRAAADFLGVSLSTVQSRLTQAKAKSLLTDADRKRLFPGQGCRQVLLDPPPAPEAQPEPVKSALAPHEADAVWKTYKAQPTDELRNQLVERYHKLVKYQAERLWSRLPDGVELDDLISAGTFGLLDAIQAYDTTRGVKFETYCIPRIRGAMLDELRHMDWVPRLVRSKASKLGEATKSLEAKLGRAPTVQELAHKLTLSVREVEAMQTEALPVTQISLSKKWYETDSYKEVREVDILVDEESEDPTERLRKREIIRYVTRGLARAERLIILMYYFEEKTMKEIGESLALSESRVSQMHSAVIERLRAARSFEDVIPLLT